MNEYYFAMLTSNEPDLIGFVIVGQQFWKETQCWDDSGDPVDNLPDGFFELEESVFAYDGQPDEGRDQLLAAGFVENNDLKMDLK
jgi:hypothetical protein